MHAGWDHIRNAFGLGSGKRCKGIKPHRRRTLTVEPLETRQLLTVDPSGGTAVAQPTLTGARRRLPYP